MSDDINNKLVNYLIHKPKDQVIDKFEEYFSFLNNDEPSWILYEGILYPSVSVAFQGARAQDFEIKQKIADVDSPDDLILLASEIEDPPDWENRRLKVMEILIRDKFRRSLELRERLRLTEEKQLVCRFFEESPSNLFWGIVGSKGQNQIGRILEKVRGDIHQNVDLKKWMQTKFPLQQDKILLPVITLNVSKDGEQIETITLKERSYYYMGQYKTNSVILAHPSISRLHACLICEEGNKVRLVDMESKSGSFVNGEILEKLFDKELQTGDILTFALSTRSYEINIDYTAAKQELQKRSIQLQQQVKQLQKLNQPSITPEELRRIMGFDIDNTLFISGLPDNATVLGIREMFERISEPKNKDENEKKKFQGIKIKVQEVKIPVDKWSGRPKGFAYVTFQTREDFNNAQLYSFGLKYGEVKLKVKVADKDKSAQLMNICKIKDGNNNDEDSKKRYDDKRGSERSRRERSSDRHRDRSSERYRDRDSKYKRRYSKSRSRSNDRKLRDKNRVSKFDNNNQDKEQKREREEVKNEQNQDLEKKQNSEDAQKKEEKEPSSKVKENKDKRKRSDSRDNNKKQDKRRDRSESKSKNQKSSSRHEKHKRRSQSPKQKRGSSQTKNESKKSTKHSRSRSRERERDRERDRDRKDNRKSNKDSRKSTSRDKKQHRKSSSKDRKKQDEQNNKSNKASELPKKSDKQADKDSKAKTDKQLAEKQSENQVSKREEKETNQKAKQTKEKKRKESVSSNSSSSQSSRSSSSSNSSNSRSSSFSSSSSSQSSS
ncbi:FHA domain protein (macronuclear) [Tetrahymena thermophila SB210]|uniref:FHA domain protein n=1 Tax=Tetrahymena thermophila (strain SB210) TaxID=312017 RepID=Q23J97_TETTS|nr:FHA domain protein [Tetrahymena thermophila SB210]EAR96607.1 FHA domain protein [Tetrahymena thermophila SB210]|eukprot:XP_001016852.1 FHA domain protein [Tetrahymena thermophila SB210]